MSTIQFPGFSNIDTKELLRQQNPYIDPIFKYEIIARDFLDAPVPEYENGESAINIKNYLLSLDNAFKKKYFSVSTTEYKKDGKSIENTGDLNVQNTVAELNKMKYVLNRLKTTITLVDDNVRKYLLRYQVEPYLINALRFEDIYLLVTQTPYFPKTRNLIVKEEQSKVEPAYEDVILPYHPYWNSPVYNGTGNIVSYRNGPRGASFTEPDFYLSNPGIDFPDSQSIEGSLSLEIKDEKLLSQVKATPEDLYNLYVDLAAEHARGDVEGLARKTNLLNADRKSNVRKDAKKKDKTEAQPGYSGEFGDIEQAAGKQYLGISSEYYKNNMTPKNFIDDKRRTSNHMVQAAGVDANGNPFLEGPEWGGQRLNFSDVSFIFGDNADYMDPLVSNFQYETDKLRTSRLANWTYQEYDFEQHEIRKIRLRNQYAVNQVDLPAPRGGRSGQARPTADKINFFYSDLYIEKAAEASQTQSLTFDFDTVLLDHTDHAVARTNCFAQVRVQNDMDKVEFFGRDVNPFGPFNFTGGTSQTGVDLVDGKLKDDVGYRFHKGIDIYPKAPYMPVSQTKDYSLITGYKASPNSLGGENVYGSRGALKIVKKKGGRLSGGYGKEYKDLIPMFAPWDMEFEGAVKSNLYGESFEMSGRYAVTVFDTYIKPELKEWSDKIDLTRAERAAIDDPNLFFFEEQSEIFALDKTKEYAPGHTPDGQGLWNRYSNPQDLNYEGKIKSMGAPSQSELQKVYEAGVKSDAIRLKLKSVKNLGFHFFRDPYVNRTWLVFKNGQNWPNSAGLRSAWKITSGPLQNTTLLLMHQSFMIEGDSILRAWAGDVTSREKMKVAIDNRDGQYVKEWLITGGPQQFTGAGLDKVYMGLFGVDPTSSHRQSVKAGEFIGFIGRTGFQDKGTEEHAHVEICYRKQSNQAHSGALHGLPWRIDLGPILEGGSLANKAVIDAYYKYRAVNAAVVEAAVAAYENTGGKGP
jgi:murein DD-endopeptidase MepM/ murein hydrolase activator NlpD